MFLLNSFVQSIGHYLQWVTVVGWDCDTWPSLTGGLLSNGKNGWTHDDGTWKTTAKGWATSPRGGEFGESQHHRHQTRLRIHSRFRHEGEPAPDSILWMTGQIFYWGWWISWAPKHARSQTVERLRVRRPVSVWILLPDHSRFSWNQDATCRRDDHRYCRLGVDWSKGSGSVGRWTFRSKINKLSRTCDSIHHG